MNIISNIVERKPIAAIAAGVIVLAGVFWLGNQPTFMSLLDENKLERVPDFFVEGVESRTYGEDGALQETITADTTTHYINQKTELLNPNIRRQNGDIITVAQAQRGTAVDASQSFYLVDNASITRFLNGEQRTRMNADLITYDDSKQMMLGEGNGELITQQGVTLSDTINFNLLNDTATLTGGVTGEYDVSQL